VASCRLFKFKKFLVKINTVRSYRQKINSALKTLYLDKNLYYLRYSVDGASFIYLDKTKYE